jgi:DegV family protein with EDD domain
MIGVVTDSAASIDPGLPGVDRIAVVPMQVEIDGRPLAETDLSADAVGEMLTGPVPPRVSTSAPAPGAFLRAIEATDDGDGVVVLTVSSRMSGTHSAAALAARMTDRRVEVVDTGTAAGAEGLVVLAAQAEAAAGGSLEAVVKQAALAAARVRMVAEVGDLRPLARSGRLPARVARLGASLGVRPVFQYRGGSVSPLRPVRSERGAREALLSAWEGSAKRERGTLHVTASYGSDRDAAEQLVDEVRHRAEPATAYVARFGPVMVAHTGPDILGLSWWWEPAG